MEMAAGKAGFGEGQVMVYLSVSEPPEMSIRFFVFIKNRGHRIQESI